jgi:hypothetical protein
LASFADVQYYIYADKVGVVQEGQNYVDVMYFKFNPTLKNKLFTLD